ncbi:hypothetical protein ALC57_10328, partial [Trachymyrmex cornetzi]
HTLLWRIYNVGNPTRYSNCRFSTGHRGGTLRGTAWCHGTIILSFHRRHHHRHLAALILPVSGLNGRICHNPFQHLLFLFDQGIQILCIIVMLRAIFQRRLYHRYQRNLSFFSIFHRTIDNNSHWMLEDHTQYPQKLNVWAGMLNNTLIDPFFIDGNLNSAKYEDMLRNEIVPAIRRIVGDNFAHTWFQQNGTGPHYGRGVRNFLDTEFFNRWIRRRGQIEGPPRSPDLSPLDYFL